MEFEWDPVKASQNESKHGASFFEATEIFGDDLSSTVIDPDNSAGEIRYIIFGQSVTRKYLVVAFTERNGRIRVISARQMTRNERRAYEQ